MFLNVVCIANELEKISNSLQLETNRSSREPNHDQGTSVWESDLMPALNQNDSPPVSYEVSKFYDATDSAG